MPQNNETAAMLVSQTSPVGVELFSNANAFFCSSKILICLDAGHVIENTLLVLKQVVLNARAKCQIVVLNGICI